MIRIVEAVLAPDAFGELMHLDTRQGVERAIRLVQQKNAGSRNKRAGKRHALALAAGENRRPIALPAFKADIGERLLGGLAPSRLPRDPDIAKDRLPGEEARVLEKKAHALLQPAHGLAANENLTCARRIEPGDEAT